MGLRRGWWWGFFWRRDILGGFCAECAALLHDGLRDGRYVVVKEEVVGACGLRERVQRGVVGAAVGNIDGLDYVSSKRTIASSVGNVYWCFWYSLRRRCCLLLR